MASGVAFEALDNTAGPYDGEGVGVFSGSGEKSVLNLGRRCTRCGCRLPRSTAPGVGSSKRGADSGGQAITPANDCGMTQGIALLSLRRIHPVTAALRA